MQCLPILNIAMFDARSMFVKKHPPWCFWRCQIDNGTDAWEVKIGRFLINWPKKGCKPIWTRALPPIALRMTKRNLTTKTKRYCIIDMKGREHPEHVLRQWSLDGCVGLAIAGGEFWTGVKSGIKVSQGALGLCINVFPWALQRNFADVLKFLRPPACHSAA